MSAKLFELNLNTKFHKQHRYVSKSLDLLEMLEKNTRSYFISCYTLIVYSKIFVTMTVKQAHLDTISNKRNGYFCNIGSCLL